MTTVFDGDIIPLPYGEKKMVSIHDPLGQLSSAHFNLNNFEEVK